MGYIADFQGICSIWAT